VIALQAGSDVFWLNTANIILGVVVAVCVAVLGLGVLREFQLRARKHTELSASIDRDLKVMLDTHAFEMPELGLTMADGGERLDKSADSPDKKKKKTR
jgi:uncharacterized membrane protein YgaE (UPF0421/DUF939 family)